MSEMTPKVREILEAYARFVRTSDEDLVEKYGWGVEADGPKIRAAACENLLAAYMLATGLDFPEARADLARAASEMEAS